MGQNKQKKKEQKKKHEKQRCRDIYIYTHRNHIKNKPGALIIMQRTCNS